MPELPEVETIKQGLSDGIVGKTIEQVSVHHIKPLRDIMLRDFVDLQKGRTVTGVFRRGKQLIIELDNGYSLLVHLKMSGSLVMVGQNSLPQKHTHIIWRFDDGSQLFFTDPRRFGYVLLVENEALSKRPELSNLGLEPIPDIPEDAFSDAAAKTKRPVKALLIDQRVVAGIGNIYADEICHLAGVDPRTPARELDGQQIRAICKAAPIILKKAIKARGTTISDYRDAKGGQGDFALKLKVYKREKCGDCGDTIVKTRITGRSTHYCPVCQR